MGELRTKGKTVLLVTHALHFVSEVDYIYTLQNGIIEEEGTYADLMEKRNGLYRLLQEHGGSKAEEESPEGGIEEAAPGKEIQRKEPKSSGNRKEGGSGEGTTTKEARTTGSVSWHGE